jgi:hypothetical protein
MAARDRLHRHETNIVAVAGVVGAGIAEADEKQHGVNGAGLEFAHDFRKPLRTFRNHARCRIRKR